MNAAGAVGDATLDVSGDSDVETGESFDAIRRWSKLDLQAWLAAHDLPRSGVKEVLAKRVYRAKCGCISSESESDHENEDSTIPSPSDLTDGWEQALEENLPPLRDEDVDNYFLFRKNPVTGSQQSCTRQLTKAKKFANENFIFDVLFHSISSSSVYCHVKGKCRPSMRQEVNITGGKYSNYTLHVTLAKSTGYVTHAFCNCKAGQSGVCSHVGGLLLTLVKIKNPCTSSACSWTVPKLSQAPKPKHWEDISIANTEKELSTAAVKPYPDVYQAGQCRDPDVFCSQLLDGLGLVNPQCVLYRTLCSKRDDISSFIDLYEPSFNFSDSLDLLSLNCKKEYLRYMNNLQRQVTDKLSLEVEVATRGQANNKNWFSVRHLILTSSNFGSICKRRDQTPPDNLLKTLRGYVSIPDHVKSAQHGRRYEARARYLYAQHHQKLCGPDVHIKECGIQINTEWPYLGTSVDGRVTCAKCGCGVLEIKCPYGQKSSSWRNMSPLECASNSSFFCELNDNNMSLKKNHNYYFQVMGQMAITQLQWCDFVVFTKKDIHVQRIFFLNHSG